jgi:predicted nuclease of predicted toxin-antitoxin system
MAIALYMDHHVPRVITNALRLRDVDVLTAYEDGASTLSDPALLDRAGELERVLFTQDDDFLVEATRRQRDNIPFQGIIYAHQLRISIGVCINDLEIIAKLGEPQDFINHVEYLPL